MNANTLASNTTTVNYRVRQARAKLIKNIKNAIGKEILLQEIDWETNEEKKAAVRMERLSTGEMINGSNNIVADAQIKEILSQVRAYVNGTFSASRSKSQNTLLEKFVKGVDVAYKTQYNLAALKRLLKMLKQAEQENATGDIRPTTKHSAVKRLGILYRGNAIVPKDAIDDSDQHLYHWEVKSAGRPWIKLEENIDVAPEMTEGFVRLVYNGTVYSNVINIRTIIRRQVHDAKRGPHRFSASNSEFQQRCYGVARRIAGLYAPEASRSPGLSMQVFQDRVRRLPEHMKMDLQDILKLCRHRFSSRKTDENSKFVRMVEFCEPTIRLNPLALDRKLKQIYSGQKITLSIDNRELDQSDEESQASSSSEEDEDLSDALSIDNRELVQSDEESQDSSSSEEDEDLSKDEINQFEKKPTEHEMNEIKAAFDTYDINKNGKLSIREFLENTTLTEELIQKLLTEHDTNRDGTLSYDEFEKWCLDTDAVQFWTNNKKQSPVFPERDGIRADDLVDTGADGIGIEDMEHGIDDSDMTDNDGDMTDKDDDERDDDDKDKKGVYTTLANGMGNLAKAAKAAAAAATAAAAIDAQTAVEKDKKVTADGDDKSSENSATAAQVQTMKVYKTQEKGTKATRKGAYFKTKAGNFYYQKSPKVSNKTTQQEAEKNGWVLENTLGVVDATDNEGLLGTNSVPSGELTEMLTNMSSDWATSDDELNFAEDSANEFQEEELAFAESSSGHDTSELAFAETSSGNDANEMVFAGSSESFSSALEFAESSDFAMTSDSDTGQ